MVQAPTRPEPSPAPPPTATPSVGDVIYRTAPASDLIRRLADKATQEGRELRIERRPLELDDIYNKKHSIQRRCITTKPDGKEGPVSAAHISRIFNPEHPNTPSPGLGIKIAEALTEIVPPSEGYDVYEVRMEDVYIFLRDKMGKELDRVRRH